MAQSVLTHTDHVDPRKHIRRLTDRKMKKETGITKRTNFDKIVRDKLGESMTHSSSGIKQSTADSSDFYFDIRKDD